MAGPYQQAGLHSEHGFYGSTSECQAAMNATYVITDMDIPY